MQKKMWLDYPSSIGDIVEQNKSFGACTLRIMYAGKNRNRTSISRGVAESAVPTMYNCPIVCHYIIDEDRIGGHDVTFMQTDNGVKMVNLTEPVGVIPAGAQYRWETVNDDGTEHDYLVVDGILWKRSNAYEKLKRDGISGQSMEITINRGESVDGVYQIYDFDFTAFCILGEDVEPCFESASVEAFGLDQYKARFEQMMEDFKTEYASIAATGSGIEFSSKGGEGKVNLTEMMAEYGLVEEDITFETNGLSAEELETKFAELGELKKSKFAEEEGEGESGPSGDPNDEPSGEPSDNQEDDSGDDVDDGQEDDMPATEEPDAIDVNGEEESDASGDNAKRNQFALMAGQLTEELYRALSKVTFHDDYWNDDCRRYWYIDHDTEAQKVYADDWMNCVICGFNYSMNGDNVVIDFDSYKRQKVQFVDFDEGDPTMTMFSKAHEAMKEVFDRKIERATADMEELRKFHDETVAAQRKKKLDEVFASFTDLVGNENFEALKSNCDGLSVDDVSEKCFAIRGRSMKMNFSANAAPASVRLPVERVNAGDGDEPYNGIFAKYGFKR